MPTLKFRRATGDLIEVYKHLNIYDHSVIVDKSVPRTHPSRRHSYELKRLFAKDCFKGVQTNSFYFQSIEPWNNLPSGVVESPSFQVFKKRLNEYLKSQKFAY